MSMKFKEAVKAAWRKTGPIVSVEKYTHINGHNWNENAAFTKKTLRFSLSSKY